MDRWAVNAPGRAAERSGPEIVSGSIPSHEDFGALVTHVDKRGGLTEIFREAWPGLPQLRQWNHVRNGANVMRGMHVHPVHSDYLVVLEGEMLLALRDIRRSSPSYGAAGIVRLSGENLSWALIRPGIVHGFYVPRGNVMVYGLTHGWTLYDEIGCRWDDPELGIDWPPIANPALSERDEANGSFGELVAAFDARRQH